jgi:hypothetical protein
VKVSVTHMLSRESPGLLVTKVFILIYTTQVDFASILAFGIIPGSIVMNFQCTLLQGKTIRKPFI